MQQKEPLELLAGDRRGDLRYACHEIAALLVPPFLEGRALGALVGVTGGFQGSQNREGTAEAVSAATLINKNKPFSLPA